MKLEESFARYLKTLNEPFTRNDRWLIGPKEVDFYFPHRSLAIEFNGEHFHGERIMSLRDCSPRDYHLGKLAACEAVGVKLVFVWEEDWVKRGDWVKRAVTRFLRSGGSDCDPALLRLVSVRDEPDAVLRACLSQGLFSDLV